MRERRLSNLTIYDTLKAPDNDVKHHRSDSTSSTNSQRVSNRPSSRRRRGSSVSRHPLVDKVEKQEQENLHIRRFSSRVRSLKKSAQAAVVPDYQEDSDDDEVHEEEGKGTDRLVLNPKHRMSGTLDLCQKIIPEKPQDTRSVASLSREDSLRGTFSIKESLHFDPEEYGKEVEDLTEDEMRKMIDKEFPEHSSNESLDLFSVVESVLSTPSKYDTYPNADWSQRNWVEFYGPDQQWHTAMVTRIDEREVVEEVVEVVEDSILPFVEAAILRNKKMLDTEIEKIRNEVNENRKISPHETVRKVVKIQGALDAFKDGKGDEQDEEKEDEVEGKLSMSDVLRERSLTREAEKNDELAELAELADIKKIEYRYDCGYHYKLIKHKFLRCPEEGLRVVFGDRPWLWQQYVLLKYEERVRFSPGHSDDFENLDPVEFAETFWDIFLEKFKKKNPSHPLYNEILNDRTDAVSKLREHLLKPFHILDDIRKGDEGDGWESFEDASAFTYLSVLGTGYFIPVICCAMQIFMLFILAYEAMIQTREDGREIVDCPKGGAMPMGIIWTVAIFYLTKVVPDQFMHFYKVAGNVDCPYSKMMSLRSYIHQHGEDNFGQQVGYNMDIMMNAGFKCLALIVNVYILFNTEAVIDIVLNCIALEFVSGMDEEFVQSSWWDQDQRWLRAGTMELLLRKEIEGNKLLNWEIVCQEYGVVEKDLDPEKEPVMKGFKRTGFCNGKKARVDCKNSELRESLYMRKLMQLRDVVLSMKPERPQAIREFVKKRKEFGLLAKLLNGVWKGRNSKTAMFWKFEDYRTWSYWNELLYCQVEIREGRSECWSYEEFALNEETLRQNAGLDGYKKDAAYEKYIQKQLTMEICQWVSDQHEKTEKERRSMSFRMSSRGSYSDRISAKPASEINPEELEKFRKGLKYKEQTDFCNHDGFSSVGPMIAFRGEVIQTFTFYNAYESVKMVMKRHNYIRVIGILADWVIRWIVWTISLIIFPAVVFYVIYFIPGECTDWEHYGAHVQDLTDQVGGQVGA